MLRLLTLLAAISLLFADSAPADDSHLSRQTEQSIIERVEELIEDRGIPGLSIAIASDNEPVYSRGFGVADVENGIPATEHTKYRTASIAKSMTATVVMSLVEEGKIDLDADARNYCPEYPAKQWTFTTRQLLGHLSGVRHYKSAQETIATSHYFTLVSALDTFKDDPLRHEPSSKFLYSTFGYNLLGSVAEGASGETFPALLLNRVFVPAGMEETTTDDQFALIPHRTRGYVRPTKQMLARLNAEEFLTAGELYNAPLHDTSMKIPGGGLLSTAGDLVRFAIAINTDQLLSPQTKDEMWQRQKTLSGDVTRYGLGWQVSRRHGQKNVWHSGGQAGTSTILFLVPESGTSVAVMCNLQSVKLLPLATAIADIVSPPKETDYVEAVDRLRTAVKYEVEQKGIPAFSIALVDGERTVWADGFGFRDAEKKIPATKDTVYRVGSVSKLFTDIAVMQLVEQGKLSLDEPVKTHLSDFNPTNTTGVPITLRQLMTHRSGLVRESPVGNYFDPTEPSLEETVASMNGTSLVYPPDTRTKYSNAAVAVVGAVLESQLDVSHPQQVRSAILDPLGMQHSDFEITPAIAERVATGWMKTDDGRRFVAPTFLLGTGPAGNLYSSVTDLSKFLTCIFEGGAYEGGEILNRDSFESMLTPHVDADGNPQSFGLGFHVQKLDGFKKVGHGGAVYGFSTQLEALPERKVGVAAASALDISNGVVRRITDYALRLMIATQDGQPLPEYRTTTPVPTERARELAGTYANKDDKRFVRVTELDGDLFLQQGSLRYDLRATEDDGTVVVDDIAWFGTEVKPADSNTLRVGERTYSRVSDEPPQDIPAHWRGLIGEYGWDHNTMYILEDNGQLYSLIEWRYYYPLTEVDENTFEFPDYGLYHGEGLKFVRDDSGTATKVIAAEVEFERREIGTKDGETFKITPVKPIDDLRDVALSASPPEESGDFRDPDLVELTELDPTIKLDVRYATTNNFTGAVFYKQARAFMQRPAAEAVARANQRLKERGLGLLIHDAYRPWHVTKMFWDATPDEFKDFVANPANGSRHNRGCAVDLTLYDLTTGDPIQMVAGYDEFSSRSFPLYPGGTSRQRWYRELLRATMEAEGFTVYEYEWWHFDYKDWKKYRIGNETFEQLVQPSTSDQE